MNDWSRVHMALEDPKWDFRTVKGIAKDTGLDRERVECLLDQHRPKLRQTVARDGQPVFTLKDRPRKMREIFADIRMFASKSL